MHCQIPEEFLNILERKTSSKAKYCTFIIIFYFKLCVKGKIGYIVFLVSVSCSVIIKSILGATELIALLAVISRASYMLHFNMVLHICSVLT